MKPWLAIVLLVTKKSAMRWLIHLGGPGLILLGIADNSLIPLPGSTDVVTVLLAAHRREPWFYYTILATAGAILGGYLTYRMARKGGKETLEKRFSQRKVKKVYAIFERWGFAAAAISHHSHAFGGRRHAISNQEVLDRSGRRARHSVHHPRLSRLPLWPQH